MIKRLTSTLCHNIMKRLFLSILIITTVFMANSQDPTKLTAGPSDIKQIAGHIQLGEFAPKFAELNDDVLFGEVWSRTDKLALRDRSIVTVTALVASGIIDSSLAFEVPGENTSNEWCEPVTDEEYNKLK